MVKNNNYSIHQSLSDLLIEAQVLGELEEPFIHSIQTNNNRIYYINQITNATTYNRPLPRWYNNNFFRLEGLQGVRSKSRSVSRGNVLEGSCSNCKTSWFELGIKDTIEIKEHDCMVISSNIVGLTCPWVFGNGLGKAVEIVYGLTPILVYLLSGDTANESIWSSVSTCNAGVGKTHSILYDIGWGCTYRNLMILFSSLLNLPCYRNLSVTIATISIPTIVELQLVLERSWANGFGGESSRGLGGTVLGSCKWIGIEEVACIFAFLSIRFLRWDFTWNSNGGSDTSAAAQLLTFVIKHFKYSDTNSLYSLTDSQPILLQYDNHGVVIVGVGMKEGKHFFLIYDSVIYTRTHLIDGIGLQQTQNHDLLHSHRSRRLDLIYPFELEVESLEKQNLLNILCVDDSGDQMSELERNVFRGNYF